MTTGISYHNGCLPGYIGSTPGTQALIAYCNDDDFFRHLSKGEKWSLINFLTFWQWSCAYPEQPVPILEAFERFHYTLTTAVETVIHILARHNPCERDAHILIISLTNQIDCSIYAQ